MNHLESILVVSDVFRENREGFELFSLKTHGGFPKRVCWSEKQGL